MVILSEADAVWLVDLVHLRAGYVSARVRRRVTVPRCYRCLCYRHTSEGCQGMERAPVCLKRGVTGHANSACVSDDRCFLCSENDRVSDHIAGSGICPIFREALEVERKKTYRKRTKRR